MDGAKPFTSVIKGVVSIPLRGKGSHGLAAIFANIMLPNNLDLSDPGFPSPCGGKVVMDSEDIFSGMLEVYMFPSPCGGKVVMDDGCKGSSATLTTTSFHPLAGER